MRNVTARTLPMLTATLQPPGRSPGLDHLATCYRESVVSQDTRTLMVLSWSPATKV